MQAKKLAVIIPAFNEAKTIEKVVTGIPKKISGFSNISAIVVDDGSTDETAQLAKRAGALVARHRINLGVGGATATGFAAALKLGATAAVTLDGDAQHNPEDIERLLAPILRNKADMVVGSRLHRPSAMPLVRLFGNKLFNFVTWVLYQVRTTDSQSGFRAYNRKALRTIEIRTSGYEVCSELFGEAKLKGLRIAEVPIETIYTDHSKLKGQPAINGVNIILKLVSKKLVGS